jgi:hypothetical protein
MSDGEPAASGDLCPQCYGKEWISIRGKRLRCVCVTRKVLDGTAAERRRRRGAR